MSQIVRSNKETELQQLAAAERTKLEASVNGEIAVAMKLADSPLIKRYFVNPTDLDLESIAFEEIAGYRRAFKGKNVFWVNDIDKLFYSDDAPPYVVDLADPVNYWYEMTLYETKTYNFNINYNPEMDKTGLWINAPVFDSAGTPIGMVGTGIDLTEFVDSIYQNFTTENAELYLFNSAGEVTGARDSNLVANKAAIAEVLGATGADILNRAQNIPAT
jgi:methyl-accepting chemotaxis protein